MGLNVSDYVKLIISGISFFDFIVFIILFLSFIVYVPYKSKELSTKIISVCIILFFIIYKMLYIPIFLSSISSISSISEIDIPGSIIITSILLWINVVLSTITLILGVTTAFIKKRPNEKELEKCSDKYVNIIMPIYNENPDSLKKAIKSVLNLNYPKNLIHLYLAFDEGVLELNSEAYVKLMKSYNLDSMDERYKINIEDNGVLISICRFDHGGKKSAQYGAFKEVEKDNVNTKLEKSLIFFIDSDIILKKDSLSNFTYHMEHKKKSALTGMITCITSEKPNFLKFYQDVEYVTGQILWRNSEVYMGSTTCLPGAFTILKYSFFKKVSEVYFNSNTYEDNADYQRFYLGEDRYLTHLLMEIEPWQISFCELARCKTDAPDTISALLIQRRRWYLGHIANDIWMMSSLKLWKTYPILCIFNLLNNTRNTSIYIYLVYFILLLNKDSNLYLWLGFIILPIILNWVFIILYSIKLRRKMNFVFYFVILIIQPILSMICMYYTIFTIKKKGWGGIRSTPEKIQEFQVCIEIPSIDVEIPSIDVEIPNIYIDIPSNLEKDIDIEIQSVKSEWSFTQSVNTSISEFKCLN
jgi:chitin synthase